MYVRFSRSPLTRNHRPPASSRRRPQQEGYSSPAAPETSHQQPNHGHLDAAFRWSAPCAHSPATSRRLRSNQANVRSTIHRLGCWLHPRTPGARLTTSSSQPPVALHQSAKLVSLIGLVRPNLGQSRNKIVQTCQEAACATRVVHIGWRDVERERQAQGIDQQVALTAFDTFVGIVATDADRTPRRSSHFGRP